MSFMNADELRKNSFVKFENKNSKFLNRLKQDIKKASDNGEVFLEVSFYKKENETVLKEHRQTLTAYLQSYGFKADYLNNKVVIFWGKSL